MCCLCFESVNLDLSVTQKKSCSFAFPSPLHFYFFCNSFFSFFFPPQSERVGQSNLLFLKMTCFHFLLQPGNSLERLFSGPLAEQEKAASCTACQGNRSASWQRWGERNRACAVGLAFISSPLCKAVLKFPDRF